MPIKYKKADENIIFNDDPDLNEIKVNLPKPPDEKEVIGYGDDPNDQVFKRPFMPRKLFNLNKRKDISEKEKVEFLKENHEDYEDEIDFINQDWERRINGVWYYINGKPTYIPGCYYFYLTAWYLERGYPDYRERDRKFFIFSEFCENDKDCYGFIYPKHRREGATTKAACWNYEYVSRRRRVRGGIQSMTDKHAELVFQKHVIAGWRKLPFWFRPVFEGSTNPKAVLSFNAPSVKVTRTNMGIDEMDDINSSIDFMSSTEGAYDGSRLERYHGDEIGKCLIFNTLCRMFDGSVKKVQDIVDGDLMMGPDSKHRTVKSIARGKEVCYDIIPNQGESWGCNESHVLSLKVARDRGFRGVGKGEVLNISVKEYLSLSKSAQKHLVLYRVGVEYDEKEVVIDPYILGIWLGDGHAKTTVITNPDKEVVSSWSAYAKKLGMKVKAYTDITIGMSSYNGGIGDNILLNKLRSYNLLGNKSIPLDYLSNSRGVRLELLAGLIDSDGHLTVKNGKASNYEIVQKRKELSEGIHDLILSLGFNSTIKKKVATMKRDDGSIYKCDVYRVYVYGDLYKIPCRVKRKIAKKFDYHINRRNPLHTGFKVVKRGVEKYYGFTLKEDPLFLLKDYTVTHNTLAVNVYKRHLVVRQCLSELDKIIGKCIYTSTAGEMTKGGGQQFKQLIEASDYEKRDGNGRTTSGLYVLFIPATEGYKIDKFGNSRTKESLTWLQNERKQALEEEDYEKLNESTRQFPIRLRDCFRNASDSDNFNMKILQDQLDKFQFGNNEITVGDFVWENGRVDGRVIFIPRENGKFKVSYLFPDPKDSNRSYMIDAIKVPANDKKFMGGSDTFKFKTTQGGKKSQGGGAVFMKRDFTIDSDERPIEDWETNKFVCTYLHRPKTKDEYCEDMLMMSVYYGCKMCPEINVPAVMDHFQRRGYNSYLYYVLDRTTGKYKKNPGYNTSETVRETIFRAFLQFIQNHGYRCVHHDLLEQLLEIGDDMGDYDLFVASGMALIASEDEQNFNHGEEEEYGDDVSDFFHARQY